MRTDRLLTLVLLLGLFALPMVPTTGAMRCMIPEPQRATDCRGMAPETCRAPVSFALGFAFNRAERSIPTTTPAARAAATARPVDEFSPSPWVRQVPPPPFSLLSVWRI